MFYCLHIKRPKSINGGGGREWELTHFIFRHLRHLRESFIPVPETLQFPTTSKKMRGTIPQPVSLFLLHHQLCNADRCGNLFSWLTQQKWFWNKHLIQLELQCCNTKTMVLMGSLQGKCGKKGSSVLRSLDYPLNLFLSTDYRDMH